MKKINFCNENIKVILFNIFLIIFGVLFCAMPQKFVGILEIIVSIFLILYGLINLFGYCFAPTFLKEPFMLFESIVLIVAGFLIDIVSNLFILVLGIIILVFGIKRIVSAIEIKSLNNKNWWVDLVFGIVICLLGMLVSILCYTKIVQSAVIILLGASLMFSGIINLIIAFTLRKQIKKLAEEDKVIEISGEVK